jgi:uncharacterized protein (TIGR02453 family)
MSYFNEDFIKFFKQLEKNNNRDWFNKNKKRYEESVKIPFENFVQEMLHRMHEDDESINITPKEAIFRIYKDVRFSKDKKPYKDHASAVLSAGGRQDFTVPGYYLEMRHDRIRLYGGAHFCEKGQLQNLREYISSHLKKFDNLINDKEFKKRFGKVIGEQNKRILKEFQEVALKQPLIANKQFYFFAELDGSKILAKNLPDTLMKLYRAGKPLNKFLLEGMRKT